MAEKEMYFGYPRYVYVTGPFIKTAKYLLYTFNGIFFAFSSILFALCLWVRWDPNIDDHVRNVGFSLYFVGIKIILVGATLLMVACFMAWCGAWFWSFKLIIAYAVTSIVSFILNLSGAIYLLMVGLEGTHAFPYIQENFRNLIYRYNIDVQARRNVDIIQEYIQCCGGYSPGDWEVIHLPVPNSCRDHVTGNQFGDSCAEVLSSYLEFRTGWVSGIALCICFLQLFTLVFAVCTVRGIRERKDVIRANQGQ